MNKRHLCSSHNTESSSQCNNKLMNKNSFGIYELPKVKLYLFGDKKMKVSVSEELSWNLQRATRIKIYFDFKNMF